LTYPLCPVRKMYLNHEGFAALLSGSTPQFGLRGRNLQREGSIENARSIDCDLIANTCQNPLKQGRRLILTITWCSHRLECCSANQLVSSRLMSKVRAAKLRRGDLFQSNRYSGKMNIFKKSHAGQPSRSREAHPWLRNGILIFRHQR
jgi:hypothetical protein